MSAQVKLPPLSPDNGAGPRQAAARPLWRRVRSGYLFPIILLALWVIIVPNLPTEKIPTPGKVLTFMWDEIRVNTVAPKSVYYSFAISLARLAVGVVISMTIGMIVGVASGLSRRFDAFARDYVVASLVLPGLIVALVAALWFGFTFLTPVVTVVFATFAYTASNIAEGVRDVPRDLIFMADSFGVNRSAALRHVTLPSLVPFLFVSLRYTISLGWKALTIAEIFGADQGAGWMLRFWYDANRIQGLIGYTFFFAIVTVLVDRVLFEYLARRLLAWRGDVAGAFQR